MEQICILAPAERIDAIKEWASKIPSFKDISKILTIKLSADGKEPVSYYFCAMNYTEKMYNHIMEVKKSADTDYTEIAIGDPKEILTERNLKVIKK